MSLTLLGIIVFVIGVVIVLVNMLRLFDSTMSSTSGGFGTVERMERQIRSGFRVHMLGAGVVFGGVVLFVVGLLQHFNVL